MREIYYMLLALDVNMNYIFIIKKKYNDYIQIQSFYTF